jgi:hypothetical protein
LDFQEHRFRASHSALVFGERLRMFRTIIIEKEGHGKLKISCQDRRFAQSEHNCDILTLLRTLKTEDLGSSPMIISLEDQNV